MTVEEAIEPDARPTLASHVRWRNDAARGRWVLMAPERLYVPDEVAHDVLRRFDGATSLKQVVEQLAAEYAAPRETIAADVAKLLRELSHKGLVTW